MKIPLKKQELIQSVVQFVIKHILYKYPDLSKSGFMNTSKLS